MAITILLFGPIIRFKIIFFDTNMYQRWAQSDFEYRNLESKFSELKIFSGTWNFQN